MKKLPVYVTQPALPPLSDFIPYLEKIWENNILTNNGPYHQQLENALCEYLGVKYLSLFNNGTVALICALKVLGLEGEVITTPYSFAATAHSILWNNLRPVFVDTAPNTFNIDPSKIKMAITPQTSAILGVHCYGYCCDVKEIQKIAASHNLRVIYDAAHAFGVKDINGSILNYGDLSILSFHATKVFNTFEGGAIVCHSKEMKDKIDVLKNFGIQNETEIFSLGMNGKLNEVSAAFGLLQLKYIDSFIREREKRKAYYTEALSEVPGIKLINYPSGQNSNYSYFPILIDTNYWLSRDELYSYLKSNQIYARRYFYPLLSDLSIYESFNRDDLDNARTISNSVLCLPIYPSLSLEEQKHITSLIARR